MRPPGAVQGSRASGLCGYAAEPVPSSAVACPSGLRSTPRKRVWAQVHPGFESLRHRGYVATPTGAHSSVGVVRVAGYAVSRLDLLIPDVQGRRPVGPAGVEPATYGLKVRSSAIELEAPAGCLGESPSQPVSLLHWTRQTLPSAAVPHES